MRRLLTMLTLCVFVASTSAWAQATAGERTERPATASSWGDTGLWFVPTAEVVRSGGWSFSLYRTELDFKQGVTDVSDWPLTFAVGAGSRTELFGAMRIITRIDRDLSPLFVPGNETDGGLVNDRPFVSETWTGNDFGDLFLGAKVNLLTERLNQPFALATRGTIKLPTADEDTGAGTGKMDSFIDFVASKELGRAVELTGFGGWAFRGDPDDVDLSNGFRWGAGAAFGARANLRFTAEMFGEHALDETVQALPGVVTGTDGSLAPILSQVDTGVTTAFGLTWQHSSGMSLGAALSYQFGLDDEALPDSDNGHAWGMQFRIGFHRGVRLYRPPAPPAIAAAPAPAPAPAPVAPPAPAANRTPTITASCDPCRIEVGRTSTIRATVQDPDGDPVSVRWSAPVGDMSDPAATATVWTASGAAPGRHQLTVTTSDGRGGTASAIVNIDVVPTTLAFQEVQFDLDQAALRPEAVVILARAVSALKETPGVRIYIEGHASEEGTEDYNLELGERRAKAVRDYLVSHGVEAGRLDTVSYGEERPKYDNSREETRRLNRRAALVVQAPDEERR